MGSVKGLQLQLCGSEAVISVDFGPGGHLPGVTCNCMSPESICTPDTPTPNPHTTTPPPKKTKTGTLIPLSTASCRTHSKALTFEPQSLDPYPKPAAVPFLGCSRPMKLLSHAPAPAAAGWGCKLLCSENPEPWSVLDKGFIDMGTV